MIKKLMAELQKGILDVGKEVAKLEQEEQNMAKWIKYFLHELEMIKSDIEQIKQREEVLAQSVIKLYNEKSSPDDSKDNKSKD